MFVKKILTVFSFSVSDSDHQIRLAGIYNYDY